MHILKLWNIFDGSVELLTTAPLGVGVGVAVVEVVMFVDTVLLAPVPPNNDDSALALAKLNPIDEELDVDNGTAANVIDGVAIVDDGVVSAMPNEAVAAGAAVACPIAEIVIVEGMSGIACT